MARGGFRRGAGRKPGSLTRRTRDVAERAAECGETPLEFMLRTMRDPTIDIDRRADMAKAAAPYVHPRLASIERTTVPDNSTNYVEPSAARNKLFQLIE